MKWRGDGQNEKTIYYMPLFHLEKFLMLSKMATDNIEPYFVIENNVKVYKC